VTYRHIVPRPIASYLEAERHGVLEHIQLPEPRSLNIGIQWLHSYPSTHEMKERRTIYISGGMKVKDDRKKVCAVDEEEYSKQEQQKKINGIASPSAAAFPIASKRGSGVCWRLGGMGWRICVQGCGVGRYWCFRLFFGCLLG